VLAGLAGLAGLGLRAGPQERKDSPRMGCPGARARLIW
jgi:hypothetical protein